MHITIETITPKMAESWLNLNTNNRPLREGVAEKYAADMKAGDWTNCPEPISFYADNSLADGQHRLYAIVESGVSVRMPVARGLSKIDGLNINTGLTRGLVDNARIAGVSDGLSNTLIALARHYIDGNHVSKAMSNAQKLDMVARAGEPAQWAASHVRKHRYLCGTAIGAAVARARSHGVSEDRLLEFCAVLGTGVMEGPQDRAAIAIRNYLLSQGPAASITSNWRDTFIKVQNAIAYFMRGEPLSVIRGVKDEAYPLKKVKPSLRKAA